MDRAKPYPFRGRWPFLSALALLSASLPGALPACAATADEAAEILRVAGTGGGLVVHVNCGDGKLTAALAAAGNRLVHGLCRDASGVAEARKCAQKLGLEGRVWIDTFDGRHLPYAENLVNLVVAEDLGEVSMDEVLRVLAPRGVACTGSSGGWSATEKPWPEEIDEWTHWLHGADANAVARDTVAGPPERMQWIAAPLWSRHHNTVPSTSAIVSARGRLFYIVDEAPAGMDGSAPDRWTLVARDAFNGLPLWKKPIAEWGWKAWSAEWTCRFTVPTHLPRRLVAVGDSVYVTLGFNAPLSELDAATGDLKRVFEGTEFTDEILHCDGRLILALNKGRQEPSRAAADRRGLADEPPVKKSVAAVDAASGRMLWRTGDYVGLRSKTGSMDRISHLSMCAGDGRVFFADRDRIICLDLEDGREAWRAARPHVPENKMRYDIRISDMCSLVYHGGRLYFAQLDPDREIDWREIRGRLHAYSAASGEELWSHACASWGWGHPADVFAVDGLVWMHSYQPGPRTPPECRPRSAEDLASGTSWVGSESTRVLGLDPATGRVVREVSNFAAFNNGHHHRCYRNKATARFMMTSFRGLEFIPFSGEAIQTHHWVRGTCRLGAIPCNGLVYSTPHPCDCYISSKLNGFVALAPGEKKKEEGGRGTGEQARGAEERVPRDEKPRLERGPAYGRVQGSGSGVQDLQLPSISSRLSTLNSQLSTPADWPSYRHDPQRSGATPSPLSAALAVSWQTDVGSRPTACVVAEEKVFLAKVDAHEVAAFDSAGGRPQWTFTAGGRIDTPPTIWGGRAFFGSADGWVYCLRASDGLLAWRFRAAPDDRLIGALDGIESAWPVHGSVLVDDGKLYLTAGRSSLLDGGIHAYVLDAESGEVLSHETIATPHSLTVDFGRDQSADTGLLSDLLVCRGGTITMRQHRLFAAQSSGEEAVGLYSTAGLLDDEWFSRTRWHLDSRPVAEYCVFDADAVYGVAARSAMSANGGFFTPGAKGYKLFAAERAGQGKPSPKKRWSIRVPVRVNSLVLAAGTLLAAGTPDVIDPDDPWAAYQGARGGRLMAFSAADGKLLAEYPLDAPPVLDGLAVAGGRLLVSSIDGRILCYAGDEK